MFQIKKDIAFQMEASFFGFGAIIRKPSSDSRIGSTSSNIYRLLPPVFGDPPLVKGLFPSMTFQSCLHVRVLTVRDPLWLIVFKSNFLSVTQLSLFLSVCLGSASVCITCCLPGYSVCYFPLTLITLPTTTYRLFESPCAVSRQSMSQNKIMSLFEYFL